MSRVTVERLTIEFPLFSAESRSLKSAALSLLGRGSFDRAATHRALDHVSFEIAPGDRLCLIGLNGAGKTTLLRAIAGILPPTEGRVEIEGRVTPLLDFATGFEMELTGYDNIIARGLFLGYSVAEMRRRRSAIADFADLGRYIHQPVKVYSSGMFLRLAFAIATAIDPDILVIDEIVGVGDQAFAARAQARMIELIGRGSIVILATHALTLASELCNTGLWLERGRIVRHGDIRSVIAAYAAAVPA